MIRSYEKPRLFCIQQIQRSVHRYNSINSVLTSNCFVVLSFVSQRRDLSNAGIFHCFTVRDIKHDQTDTPGDVLIVFT